MQLGGLLADLDNYDPIAPVGDLSRYAYTLSNPVNLMDPTGESSRWASFVFWLWMSANGVWDTQNAETRDTEQMDRARDSRRKEQGKAGGDGGKKDKKPSGRGKKGKRSRWSRPNRTIGKPVTKPRMRFGGYGMGSGMRCLPYLGFYFILRDAYEYAEYEEYCKQNPCECGWGCYQI